LRGQEKTFPNLLYHAGAAISTGLRPRTTAGALKKLMQSTHIYRASGVVGYKRKKYAAYDKGRAEFPEPDFPCRSFRSYQNLVRKRCPQTLLYATSPAPQPYDDSRQTTSDTGHRADADGLKGLTGYCIFSFG